MHKNLWDKITTPSISTLVKRNVIMWLVVGWLKQQREDSRCTIIFHRDQKGVTSGLQKEGKLFHISACSMHKGHAMSIYIQWLKMGFPIINITSTQVFVWSVLKGSWMDVRNRALAGQLTRHQKQSLIYPDNQGSKDCRNSTFNG